MVDRERAAKAAEGLGNYRRTDEEKYFENLSRCYEALLRKLTRNLRYKIAPSFLSPGLHFQPAEDGLRRFA